jgi:23S rRNA pseudouridine2605 synthase
MRINKFIASGGLCSRRAAEKFVTSGAVKINGKTVTNLSTDVNVDNDTVTVNGERVEPVRRFTYIMMYKPKGCVCTLNDDKGRKTVVDYLGDFREERIYPVGRLDYDTEGLLILTNDGNLANTLTQPSKEIPKTYIAKIEGEVPKDDIKKLKEGVTVDGIKLKPCNIVLTACENNITRLEITIFEGKNREIHKMFETIGKEIIFLKRTQIGKVKLGGLGRGAYRFLSEKELSYLRSL